MNYVIIHTKYFNINFLIDLNHPLAVKPGQAYPQDSINEFIIQKPLLVVDFRFIFTFLRVQWAVNSHALVFMKIFLPAHFSWIWCKCLSSNFVHSKIFQADWMQGRFLKYSLLRISHRLLKHFPEKKIDRKCKRRLRLEGIITNIYKCWNNYYLLIKNYNDTIV